MRVCGEIGRLGSPLGKEDGRSTEFATPHVTQKQAKQEDKEALARVSDDADLCEDSAGSLLEKVGTQD